MLGTGAQVYNEIKVRAVGVVYSTVYRVCITHRHTGGNYIATLTFKNCLNKMNSNIIEYAEVKWKRGVN